jgi:glycosyltransferase involved in cell wall biosynthesis
MRIVIAHNFYQQSGGEDQCVTAETAVLRRHGHCVLEYCLHNDQIRDMRPAAVAMRTVWNPSAYRALRRLLQEQQPDIIHFHNTFPLLSPAAYYAARAEGIGVVQTLHNFRLTCAGGALFRNGGVCENCLGRYAPWPSIWRKCYRNSRAASATITAMLAAHRAVGTWQNAVDVYIALTEFARGKLVAAGLPAERIVVKPNFVDPDSGPGKGNGGYGVFAGRLSAEKGVRTLLDAWRELNGQVPLWVIGDGPLAPLVKDRAASDPAIRWLGSQPVEAVYRLLGGAAFAVVPSQCFETFSRVVVEAFAKGTPVLASRMGAMAELVKDGRTGLLFTPSDPLDLARAIRRLLADPAALARMRCAARNEFARRFTAERNHQMLMAVYAQALAKRAGEPRPVRI